jgi:hypothetical protein
MVRSVSRLQRIGAWGILVGRVRLLELARLTGARLVDADGVYDLADVNDRLLLGLKGTVSEAELHLLAARMHKAKMAAAGRGELRFPLPVVYAYGRSYMERKVNPDGSVRSGRRYRPRSEWPTVIYDHHEAYITWQQFLDNEAKLAANRTHDGARPARDGEPLCQGIIYCGACGMRMGTHYRSGAYVTYQCMEGRRDAACTPNCRRVLALHFRGRRTHVAQHAQPDLAARP